MVWYADGSIQVEANGQVATGTGTAFLKSVRIGDGLTIAGSASMHEVTNIASDTQLTFSPPYTGAAGAGKQYRIAPIQGYVKEAADLLRSLTQNLGGFANSPTLKSLAELQGSAGQALRFKSAGELEAFLLGTAAAKDVTKSATDVTGGRLLKVGDFGVGATLLMANPDVNQIMTQGSYYCSAPANAPTAENGYLIVETVNASYIKQTYTTVVSGITFTRQLVEGVYQPWVASASLKNTLAAEQSTTGSITRIYAKGQGRTEAELDSVVSYLGAIEIRELDMLTNTKGTAPRYRPGITFHWGALAVSRLSMNQSAQLFWGADKVMVESDLEAGSNANGQYIKLPGGLMICRSINKTRPAVAGVLEFTWPASFLPSGAYVDTFASIVPASLWENASGVYGYPTGAQVYFNAASPNNGNLVSVTGIGRWK